MEVPLAMKTGVVQFKCLRKFGLLAIQGQASVPCGAHEAQGIIGLEAQSLTDVGEDACAHQGAVEIQTFIGEVVQTVDHEGIALVVEVVPLVSPVLYRGPVIEDETFLGAVELGIFRILLLLQTALVARRVDLQRAGYILQHVLHLHQPVPSFIIGLEALRQESDAVNIQQVDHKGFIVEEILLAIVGELTGLHHTAEAEVPVLFDGDELLRRIDIHILGIAHGDPRDPFQCQVVIEQVDGPVHAIRTVAVELQHIVVHLART